MVNSLVRYIALLRQLASFVRLGRRSLDYQQIEPFQFIVKFKDLLKRFFTRRFLVKRGFLGFLKYLRISSSFQKCSLIEELSSDVLGGSVCQLVAKIFPK